MEAMTKHPHNPLNMVQRRQIRILSWSILGVLNDIYSRTILTLLALIEFGLPAYWPTWNLVYLCD